MAAATGKAGALTAGLWFEHLSNQNRFYVCAVCGAIGESTASLLCSADTTVAFRLIAAKQSKAMRFLHFDSKEDVKSAADQHQSCCFDTPGAVATDSNLEGATLIREEPGVSMRLTSPLLGCRSRPHHRFCARHHRP